MTQSATARSPAAEPQSRRDRLILENLPLVSAIAGHIGMLLAVHIERGDLVDAGMTGLFDAAMKYRDDEGVPFRAYARHRIRGAILDSLRETDWASRTLRKRYCRAESVRAAVSVQLQRDPSELEMAEAMGMTLRRWQRLMVDFRGLHMANHSQPRANEREDGYVSEMAAGPADAPDKVFAREELKAKMLAAMESLPARHRRAVEMYYFRDLTMREIGGVLGVTEGRVSQMRRYALARMQSVLRDAGIQSPRDVL